MASEPDYTHVVSRVSVMESRIDRMPDHADLRSLEDKTRDWLDALVEKLDKKSVERAGNLRGELKADAERLALAIDKAADDHESAIAELKEAIPKIAETAAKAAVQEYRESRSWGAKDLFQALAGAGGIVFIVLQFMGFDVFGALSGM